MKSGKDGFSLIELLIVIAILSILVSTVNPFYNDVIIRAKESTLKKNLYIVREALDSYYLDNIDSDNNNIFPRSLEELVYGRNKYLRYIPKDPITESDEWYLFYDIRGGISDIASLSTDTGSNNKSYNEW